MAHIYIFTAAYFFSLLMFSDNRLSLCLTLPPIILYLLIALFLAIRNKRPNLIFIIIGGLLYGAFIPSLNIHSPVAPDTKNSVIIFDGYVTDSPAYNSRNTVYQINVQRYISNEKLFVQNFRMQYIVSTKLAEPIRGDLIRGRCRLFTNEDNEYTCIGKEEETPVIIERRHFGLLNSIDEYKKGISSFILTRYKGDIGQILIALSTGNSKELSYEVRRIFAQSGTSHILAISGTHIGLIAVLLYYLLKVLLFPLTFIKPFSIRKLSSLSLIPLIIIISLYFGNSPSVVRATIMVVVYLFSVLLERERDLLSSLCFAFIIITSFSPDSLRDIGFQLSFLSVLGIITFVPSFVTEKISTETSIPRKTFGYLKTIIMTSVAASIFTLPAVAFHFGIISVLGIIANIILVPFVALISLPMIMAGVIFYGISHSLSAFFLNGAFISLEHFYRLNILFASLPLSHIKVFRPHSTEIVAFYILLIALTLRNRISLKKFVIPALISVLILTTLVSDRIAKNNTKPLFVVRGGIITLIDSEHRAHLVADRNATGNDKRRSVEFLRRNRIVSAHYINNGLQDDTYLRDHLYLKKADTKISRSEGGDILISFQGFYVYIYSDTSVCPPASARYIISRRSAEEAVARLSECGILAERLIFSGNISNPKLPEVLGKHYGEEASKILICREEDCEILIEPSY